MNYDAIREDLLDPVAALERLEAEHAKPNGDAAEEEQGSFRVVHRRHGQGVYRLVEKENKETDEVEQEWVWFASLVEVLAYTRNGSGEDWGRLLAIHDKDGTVHQWAMPMSMMAGNGETYRSELLRRGMVLSPGTRARNWLADFLATWKPKGKARCVDRVGWHGNAFVLPDQTFGDTDGENVILQIAGSPPQLGTAGTLESWKENIAGPAAGNTRLVMAISTALAGPLVYLAGEESGGFHFHGASSIGKTVTLHASRSVWGLPLESWRTTDNAAEGLARGACDLMLPLDEIGQASPQVVEALAYLLGNQRGKARMRRDASSRERTTWRVLFLSTGEVGFATRMAEGGKRAMAGQAVRVVEIPADAGGRYGIFDTLNGFKDGAELAEHLRLAADQHCGHAGRAFLDRLSSERDRWAAVLREARQKFIAEKCPQDADGQVKRVCGRFALVAAAGELATAFGVTPWKRGEAEEAGIRCFNDWLSHRGGKEPAEITAGLRQVRLFLEQHGSSRFEPIDATPEGWDIRTVNRAGYRRRHGEETAFFILPESWRNEVCKGFNPAEVAKAMAERGWLICDAAGKLQTVMRIPGNGPARVYHIPGAFIAAGGDQ